LVVDDVASLAVSKLQMGWKISDRAKPFPKVRSRYADENSDEDEKSEPEMNTHEQRITSKRGRCKERRSYPEPRFHYDPRGNF
jgi:hypothetical protein